MHPLSMYNQSYFAAFRLHVLNRPGVTIILSFKCSSANFHLPSKLEAFRYFYKDASCVHRPFQISPIISNPTPTFSSFDVPGIQTVTSSLQCTKLAYCLGRI